MTLVPSHRLRCATPDDLAAIMALETSTFVTDAWSSGTMRSELESEHSYYLVAVGDEAPADGTEEIIGYAGLRAMRGSADADIQTIAVAPSARRAGVGRSLMLAMLEEARRRGAHEVFLEVRADNPGAQRLYDSLGFRRLAVRRHYYQPDDVDALVMRLTLPIEAAR